MDRTASRQTRSTVIRRRTIAPLLGALLAACVTSSALAISESDVPSGRLGYTWVPDPSGTAAPSETTSQELGLQVAKYGGGTLVALWLLGKLFGGE